MIPRILNGIEHYLKNIKNSLAKIDISLKNPNNVKQAFDLYEKSKLIKDLEYMLPKLRPLRKELSKKFFGNIQTSIDQFQKAFKLNDERFYLLEKTKETYHQLKKDAEFQKKLLNYDKTSKNYNSFQEKLNTIEESIIKYQNLITETEKDICYYSKENRFDFSNKLDFQLATRALEYIEACENIGFNSHLTKIISRPYELLRKYIEEFGNNKDREIGEIYSNSTLIKSPDGSVMDSFKLAYKISEFINLKKFNKIFEIIEGNDKVNNWIQISVDWFKKLSENLKKANKDENFDDLSNHLETTKVLIPLDHFFNQNGLSFEKLHADYKEIYRRQTHNNYTRVIEYISNKEFTRADEELTQIDNNSLNSKSRNQIKSILNDSVGNLLKETILAVEDLNNSIEKGISDVKINCIRDNIKKAKSVSRGISLSEYLDTNLTNFEDIIIEIFRIL